MRRTMWLMSAILVLTPNDALAAKSRSRAAKQRAAKRERAQQEKVKQPNVAPLVTETTAPATTVNAARLEPVAPPAIPDEPPLLVAPIVTPSAPQKPGAAIASELGAELPLEAPSDTQHARFIIGASAGAFLPRSGLQANYLVAANLRVGLLPWLAGEVGVAFMLVRGQAETMAPNVGRASFIQNDYVVPVVLGPRMNVAGFFAEGTRWRVQPHLGARVVLGVVHSKVQIFSVEQTRNVLAPGFSLLLGAEIMVSSVLSIPVEAEWIELFRSPVTLSSAQVGLSALWGVAVRAGVSIRL